MSSHRHLESNHHPYTVRAACSCRIDVFLKNFALFCLFVLFVLEIGTGIDMYNAIGCEMSQSLSVQKWIIANGFLGAISMFTSIFIVNDFERIRPLAELVYKLLLFFEVIWNIIGTTLLLAYCQFFYPKSLYVSFVLSIIYNYILHSMIISVATYRKFFQNTITANETQP